MRFSCLAYHLRDGVRMAGQRVNASFSSHIPHLQKNTNKRVTSHNIGTRIWILIHFIILLLSSNFQLINKYIFNKWHIFYPVHHYSYYKLITLPIASEISEIRFECESLLPQTSDITTKGCQYSPLLLNHAHKIPERRWSGEYPMSTRRSGVHDSAGWPTMQVWLIISRPEVKFNDVWHIFKIILSVQLFQINWKH